MGAVVEVIGGTGLIGKIMGDSADVPAYHHQAVGRLGRGLAAVAWAEDQVVEALELQGHRFGLAVQWHPEDSAATYPVQAAVFRHFVAAAEARARHAAPEHVH